MIGAPITLDDRCFRNHSQLDAVLMIGAAIICVLDSFTNVTNSIINDRF